MSGFPYSCLLLSMCNAYAEIGSFVWIYLVCSRCRISIEPTVWPTYDLLHVLHCNLYMPLEFILFSGILSHNFMYIVLHTRNAMFKSILLNKLVTSRISGLWYVNVVHFFRRVCVNVLSVFVF